MQSNLLENMVLTRLIKKLTITPARNASIWKQYNKMNALANWEGGVKYPGFTYYPKPGEVDPPHDPPKLFMVQRIKPWKGIEYWNKKILFDFKLDETFKLSKITIIKNTPDNNMKLWKVKHLVKITPITFPNGEPTENDVYSTYLNHKGELEIKKSIDKDHIQKVEQSKPNPIQLKKLDLKRQSLQVWQQGWKSMFDH